MQSNESLASVLEAKVQRLSQLCIQAMYRDPFWEARFGARGRQHAEQDSAYHVKYVVAALRADDHRVFENYVIWLRGVLASRGMCTWHLGESFRQLALAMAAEQVAEHERAVAVLEAGAAALLYSEGPAAALQARSEQALGGVLARSPEPPYRLDELWSFLLDGVARVDSQAMAKHVAFLQQALTTTESERTRLSHTLQALHQCCEHEDIGAARARALIEACLVASPVD